MPTERRGKMFTMRMTEDESERFTQVAEHLGLTLASTFRMLLKREHDKLTATRPRRARSAKTASKPTTRRRGAK